MVAELWRSDRWNDGILESVQSVIFNCWICYMFCLGICLVFMHCLSLIETICSSAVKFGRMSKKQREKVEDEAKYHKSRMSGMSEEGLLPLSTSLGSDAPINNNIDLQRLLNFSLLVIFSCLKFQYMFCFLIEYHFVVAFLEIMSN